MKSCITCTHCLIDAHGFRICRKFAQASNRRVLCLEAKENDLMCDSGLFHSEIEKVEILESEFHKL